MSNAIQLNNNVSMPLLGFGTFQIDPKNTTSAVLTAIETGYRSIDTAYSYKNEKEIGNAIKSSSVTRDKLFITSKAYINQMGYQETTAAINNSLKRLQTDYLDLYLIHMPFGDYYGAWRAIIDAQKNGKLRAIGVSNFDSARLIDLTNSFDQVPQINQIEHHPFFQRANEIKIMRDLKIQPETWAPFAEGLKGMFTNPILSEISKLHEKSIPQIILRWNVQLGLPVIAKSLNTEHLKQNLEIFDFNLSETEMNLISNLDTGKPAMLDIHNPKEVKRVYNYLNNPILTSIQ